MSASFHWRLSLLVIKPAFLTGLLLTTGCTGEIRQPPSADLEEWQLAQPAATPALGVLCPYGHTNVVREVHEMSVMENNTVIDAKRRLRCLDCGFWRTDQDIDCWTKTAKNITEFPLTFTPAILSFPEVSTGSRRYDVLYTQVITPTGDLCYETLSFYTTERKAQLLDQMANWGALKVDDSMPILKGYVIEVGSMRIFVTLTEAGSRVLYVHVLHQLDL
jgi:hypothetical protein